MMTEDEAKMKWCPFARQMVTLDAVPSNNPIAVASANRFQDNLGGLCLATGCMVWRQETRLEVPDDPAVPLKREHTGRGYCGLASPP